MKDWGWNGVDSWWYIWIILGATQTDRYIFEPANYSWMNWVASNVGGGARQLEMTIELRMIFPDEESWKNNVENMGKENENSPFNIKPENPEVSLGLMDNVMDWILNIGKYVMEGTMYLLLKLVRLLVDIVQIICNIIQLGDIQFLMQDAFAGTAYSYTKYGKAGSLVNEGKYLITVDENTYKYMSSPEIPLIAGDFYYVATNKTAFLDINFLTGEKDHKGETIWNLLKNFSVTVIHICLYVSVAFIIIALIIHSTNIVLHSVDSPEKKVTFKKGLQKFAISVIQLVSTILIISLCIFGNKMLISVLGFDNGLEGPIRVDVPSAGYSFSTTPTGYARFMSQIDGLDNWLIMGKYTLAYLVLTIVNLAVIVFMLIRMFIMWMLAILGPIIAALNSINVYKPMKYGTWVELYVKLTLVQSFMIIGYKIILESAI